MGEDLVQRSNATIIELARDLAAAVHPTTGDRATGRILIRAKQGKGKVFLPRNWAMIPLVNGAAREDLLFKVGEGPFKAKYPNGKRKKDDPNEPDAGSWWEVEEAGAVVSVVSLVGGERHNLPCGTKMLLDPQHPDLEAEAEVIGDAGITGGKDPTWLGGCMSIVQFEQLGGATVTLDAFRSKVDKFPAVVIVWDGSQPGDGTTQSSLDRGRTRVGPSQQIFKEQFNLFVLTKREDSDHLRRNEGLKLLDDLAFWLTDAMSVDGQQFSVPTGVQIRGRSRVAGNSEAFQQVYVYLLQLSVTALWKRYDALRSFNPWLRTRMQTLTHEKDEAGERLVTTDQLIDMTTSDDSEESDDDSEEGVFDETFDETFD